MTDMNHNDRQRKMRTARTARGRARSRGAALVEAAVVIPVMLVFLGCIIFVHHAYDVKIDKQWGTRSGSLYYASHNCQGALPEGLVKDVEEVDTGMGTNPADGKSKHIGSASPDAQAGLNRSWQFVKAQPPETVVTGSAVDDRKRVGLKRSVSAASEVACNEEAFSNKWTAVFQFMGSFARSGGGLPD